MPWWRAPPRTLAFPFLVLRAIADPAHRTLPSAALIPLTVDGAPAFRQVIGEVLRRPRQIGALLGVAREMRLALRALGVVADALGRELAGVPFAGVEFAGVGLAGVETGHGVLDVAREDILGRPLPI